MKNEELQAECARKDARAKNFKRGLCIRDSKLKALESENSLLKEQLETMGGLFDSSCLGESFDEVLVYCTGEMYNKCIFMLKYTKVLAYVGYFGKKIVINSKTPSFLHRIRSPD